MTLSESVSQPLFGAPSPQYPGEEIETGFRDELVDDLRRRGLTPIPVAPGYLHLGSCHALLFDHATGQVRGVADPRRRGMARGF